MPLKKSESLSNEFAFCVPGKPKGKARARMSSRTGRWYTPQATEDYEAEVQQYALIAKPKREYIEHPCRLTIEIWQQPPKSWSKKRKKEVTDLKYPITSKPDLDNIVKIIMDALNGIAWNDDKQVYAIDATRHYHEEEDQVSIRIRYSPMPCM